MFVSTTLAQTGRERSLGFNGVSSLTVTVYDKQNQPLPDARVEVRRLMGVGPAVSGYTNRSGMFEATGLANGAYEVVAQKGVLQASERVEVSNGLGSASLVIETRDEEAREVGGTATVSVAQYKVPKKAREQLKKAQAAVEKRKIDEARKHLAAALEAHPEFAEALTLRGLINLEHKNLESAISDLDQAIKADPNYPLAHLAMGAAFNAAQRFDEALRVLERGATLSPDAWQAHFEMAKAHIGKGDYPAAIRSAERAQRMSDGKYAPVHLVKAHALLALKEYDDAMIELQAFIDRAPQSPQADGARTTLEQVRAFVAQQ